METLRLDVPAEALPYVTLALYRASGRVLTIHQIGRADIDAGNLWTDGLPLLVDQLDRAAVTETDHETGRALIATARHLEAVYAARIARRARRTP